MASTAFTAPQAQPQGARSFFGKLNGPWHKRALQTFMIVVIAHWAEHLVQAYQVYVLKWPVHQARGVLGQAFPWLVHSEVLHYSYALIMLVGVVARGARDLVLASRRARAAARSGDRRPYAVRVHGDHEQRAVVVPAAR